MIIEIQTKLIEKKKYKKQFEIQQKKVTFVHFFLQGNNSLNIHFNKKKIA